MLRQIQFWSQTLYVILTIHLEAFERVFIWLNHITYRHVKILSISVVFYLIDY